MKKCVLLLAMSLFLVPGVLLAPEPDTLFQVPFQVYVGVTSDDQKVFIESYVKRELRSLHDVEIASSDKATFFLDIVAQEHIRANGLKDGNTSIAYCHYQRAPASKFMRSSSSAFEAMWEDQDKFFSFTPPELYVMVWNTDNLAEACKRIVAALDQEALEPKREANRRLKEVLSD